MRVPFPAELFGLHADILPDAAWHAGHPAGPADISRADPHYGWIRPPYPTELVPLIPEFLTRRRAGFTYPLRVFEELGIDRPAFAFLVAGVALQPDEGSHLEDLFNPYATTLDDHWQAAAETARGAGLVGEVGGRWRATPKGRALAQRVRREADAYLATLAPIPAPDLTRLAAALGEALAAIQASDLPHDHLARTARFVGDATIPMVALENALFGLWMARDDAHMSSWREAGFDGPAFDVLTRIWRREAGTEGALAAKLAQQRPEDVRAALDRMRREGLVEADGLALTAQGASARHEIEDETDRRFFAPWPEHVGSMAPWIAQRLAIVNASFLPAS